MSSLHVVNPRADLLRKNDVLDANLSASNGLQDLLQSNLGPRGTYKLLVGGGGTLKMTKDGNVLLKEMQIQHPTAGLIARAATAQDVSTGDGTTGSVLLIGELMRNLKRHIEEGVHPRLLCAGLEKGRDEAMRFLDEFKRPATMKLKDRELLESVARCSLVTKIESSLADQLARIVVDAIYCLAGDLPGNGGSSSDDKVATSSTVPDEDDDAIPFDLHMVEVLHMKQGLAKETRLIRGMVMDHGCRHPSMPTHLKNCYILTCNVSLEYEKAEVNAGFFYSSAEQRERLAIAERKFTDEKVRKIIELKRKVCTAENGMSFVVLNQKGIDVPSLDMFAKENIMALRRCKRRNMERLVLCCGGNAVNSVDELSIHDLGYAGEVWETSIGDEKYTFVEKVKHPKSCCILIKGATDYVISQLQDAIRDGLRAVHNVLSDKSVVPGAGAFEIACSHHLLKYVAEHMTGKPKLGAIALAESFLVIPKALARNSGFDVQETLMKMQEVYAQKYLTNSSTKVPADVGLDILTGEVCVPSAVGIWDNYCVKRQQIALLTSLVEQLILVDEVMKAGKYMGRP